MKGNTWASTAPHDAQGRRPGGSLRLDRQRAFGADQITSADVGGAPGAAIRKAFYDPFEKETGIRVVGVVHESDPITQFKLLVDTKASSGMSAW